MNKVLITGASGLIGRELTSLLKISGFETRSLSRRPSAIPGNFVWNPKQMEMDEQALKDVSTIINLAGAGIADKAWTESRKRVISESRLKSLDLLYESVKQNENQIHTIVSASAIGIYGNGGDEWKTEESEIDQGFLQDTCREWEKSVLRFEELGIRVVILRISIVLSKKGGALAKMSLPIKLLAGASLGTGKQFLSWIHIEDLCKIFLFALEHKEIQGIYNACASNPHRNKEFYKILAKRLKRPLWPFSVPEWIMKIIMGERAELVLSGQRVSNVKIKETGIKFRYEKLDDALSSIY